MCVENLTIASKDILCGKLTQCMNELVKGFGSPFLLLSNGL